MNELPEVPDTNLLPFDENLDGGQQFDVENIVVHPKFNPFTYEHDIALVRNIWFFLLSFPQNERKNISFVFREREEKNPKYFPLSSPLLQLYLLAT